MAKTKVKLKLDPRLSKSNLFGKRFQQSVGTQVVMAMREAIAQGLSPVKGVGRFVAYKAQRASNDVKSFATTQGKDKQGFYRKMASKVSKSSQFYPNSVKKDFPSKQARPVNLELDGSFLDTLGYDARDGAVAIGHIDPSEHTKNLFEAHNEGLNTKAQVPQRKYLPNKRGDEFIVSIMRLIKGLYEERIRQIIGKK